MIETSEQRNGAFLAVRRFFRTSKGLLLLILLALTAVAAPSSGFGRVLPSVVGAVAVAAVVDLALSRLRRGRWAFPSGAILTGLIVALVLSPMGAWYVPMGTAALAILGKHTIRTRTANVFNPAALGLVASTFIFGSGQSWWGSLPTVQPWLIVLLLATGLFIADRINKLPMLLAFAGCFYLLFTLTAFVGDPSAVVQVYRAPDVNAALFFAFFMLDDPPTSSARYPDQVRFGVLVGFASWAVFVLLGAVYYLLAGLLVGNAWEAWRRTTARAAAR